jgi:hypothetical protein
MTEHARNAILTNIVLVSLAVLLSCCTNDRETKYLLLGTVGQTPDTEDAQRSFACQQYGFYPGTKQYDDCLQYVGTKRSILPSQSPR